MKKEQYSDCRNISIYWKSGDILLEGSNEEGFSFYETIKKGVRKNVKMCYEIVNDELSIYFDEKKKKRYRGFGGLFFRKSLVVKIPGDMEVSSVLINSGSAGISVEDCRAKELIVDNASGEVRISGSLFDSASIRNITGKIAIENSKIRELSTDVVTGSTKLSGEIEKIRTTNVTGSIKSHIDPATKEVYAKTVTGGVYMYLSPACGGVDMQSNNITGRMVSDLELVRKDNHYIYGQNPKVRMRVKSVLGNMHLIRENEKDATE